jgi:hypothetical protein
MGAFQMNNTTPADTGGSRLFLLCLHCTCAVVVVLYVHLFSLFRVVRDHLGSGFISIAPLLLPLFIGVLLIPFMAAGVREKTISWGWLLVASVFTGAALCIPDPNLAVKRIHVTEYILLSLLVRYTLSHRQSGIELFIYSCLLTSLFGVHDELLQGLHPARTYGLRDMMVNSLAAIAGNCFWHGLALFCKNQQHQLTKKLFNLPGACYTLWLTVSVVLFALPLVHYRHEAIPFWTIMPLAASFLVWNLLFTGKGKEGNHSLISLSLFSFSLLFYPVIINVFQVPFY